MKKLLLVLLFALPLSAQDFPKVEVFGGYAVTSLEGDSSVNIDRQYFHGWGASITGNFSPWMGLAFHAGGAYGTIQFPVAGQVIDVSTKAHAFLVGPEFSARSGLVRAFIHPLIGGTRISASADAGPGLPNVSDSTGDFSWAIGGGIDVGRGKLAARAFQFDFIRVHDDPVTNNYRLAAGLVGRF